MDNVAFKVYYENGETFIGRPEDAPYLGVALIVELDENHNKRIVSGGDYYIWNPERMCWISGDVRSMEYYKEVRGWKTHICGVMMHQEDYNNMWRKADKDEDFPERTAYYPWEEKPKELDT
jgi:hypothetical protein